jgi:CYTH domain-containing protein
MRGWRWESRCSSQGYLSSHKERVVRVRIEGERAVMTIKGANKGATRGEWEYEIPVADAASCSTVCASSL